MLKLNSELRAEARVALSGKWLNAALITLIYLLIYSVVGAVPKIGSILALVVCAPLVYGLYIVFWELLTKNKRPETGKLFDGFKEFDRIGGTMILTSVYTFLWMLLLIIPGIVKSYSYALTPYILKEHPEMRNNKAIEMSMRMMRGHKMKLFLLDLSFIGWALLSILTLGIGVLFLEPYMATARAAFYEDLKAELAVEEKNV